jgi:hypothetical protein
VYISFEPLELRKIFCRDDGTKGVCKLDDLSPYGYNFSICRKELITPTVVFLQLKENGIQFSILIQMSGNKFIYSLLKLQHVQNYIGFNLELVFYVS